MLKWIIHVAVCVRDSADLNSRNEKILNHPHVFHWAQTHSQFIRKSLQKFAKLRMQSLQKFNSVRINTDAQILQICFKGQGPKTWNYNKYAVCRGRIEGQGRFSTLVKVYNYIQQLYLVLSVLYFKNIKVKRSPFFFLSLLSKILIKKDLDENERVRGGQKCETRWWDESVFVFQKARVCQRWLKKKTTSTKQKTSEKQSNDT